MCIELVENKMGVRQKLKNSLIKANMLPQQKKWVRVIDSMAAVYCFISAIIAIYLLNAEEVLRMSRLLNALAWFYLIASLPLAYLLYRESKLKKYERLLLVLFILSGSINLSVSLILAV